MLDTEPRESTWRKASASGGNGCVEVALLADGGVAIRDSKARNGPVLRFTRHEWDSFADGMKKGEFDHVGDAHPSGGPCVSSCPPPAAGRPAPGPAPR
jgi:hypothetical protein